MPENMPQTQNESGEWVPAVPIPYDPRDGRGPVAWFLVRLLHPRWDWKGDARKHGWRENQ